MRDIKFRGKTNEINSWWTYGNLVICDNGDYQIGDCPMYGDIYYRSEVIPETVGQYTGLHDKNGKEIYEGDIVEITRPCILERGKVDFINGCFTIKSKETLLMLYQCGINNFKLEVVGNIYENSDLLKD